MLPVIKYPNGHGFDFEVVFNFALAQELKENLSRLPGDILLVLSLDAKFIFKDHFTQVSIRFENTFLFFFSFFFFWAIF